MNKRLKLNLKTSNFFDKDLYKIINAGKFVEEAFNNDYFKNFVLDFTYTDSDGVIHNNFHYTDKTNQEVYDAFMSGSETLTPEKDGEMDVSIELDQSWTRNVIGYTYPNTPTQWIYAKFFRNWTAEEIAGNIAHEYMHKLGFDHEFKYTFNREFSVPYAIGYFVENYSKASNNKSYFERFKAYFQ